MRETDQWYPDEGVTEAPPVESSVFQVQPMAVQHLVVYEQPDIVRMAASEARISLHAFAARRMLERVELEWPADWWEAFKERWFPEWALERWPVRYTRRRMEASEWVHKRFLDRANSRVSVEVMKPVPLPPEELRT